MDRVHRSVSRALAEFGVPRDARVLVAVSGGADSVALAHALAALGQRIALAHVHHGLRRGEADLDLEAVRALARSLGVDFHEARVDAARRDPRSPEERARELRYAALERARAHGGFDWVATAHQRDDQAETVLLRAIRGTGLDGLAAIEAVSDSRRLIRPLLEVSAAELRAYLAARGVAHRTDASNAERAIPRNRVRLDVLPALELAHPGATRNLAGLAARVHRELAGEREQARLALERLVRDGDDGLWLERAGFAALPEPRRLRVLRGLWRRLGSAAPLSAAHLARIDRFAASSRGAPALSLPGSATLWRDRDALWLGCAAAPRFPAAFRAQLPARGSVEWPERAWRLSWQWTEASAALRDRSRYLGRPDADWLVRSPEPDDRIRVDGSGRERKLKDAFASARWSLGERARALVVECDGELVWVPGLIKRSAQARARDSQWTIVAERLPRLGETC